MINTLPKSLLILGTITTILFVLIIGSIFFLNRDTTPSETPEPPPVEIITPPNNPLENPLQKTVIGQSTRIDIQKYPIKAQIVLPDNSTLYELDSGIPQKPGEVIIKDGVVVYEKINIPTNPSEPGYTNLSTLQKNYGPAERTIPGTRLYGPFSNHYIYASRGIAFTGNPHSGDVYDIAVFQPTTVENYLQKYYRGQTAELPKPEIP